MPVRRLAGLRVAAAPAASLLLATLLLLLPAPGPAGASPLLPGARALAAQAVDLPALQDEALAWLQEYLRIDTTNPPGNEIAGARFLAGILEEEGIEAEVVESAPGRGNVWARLEGGDEPTLVLLHHMDVVPADARYWDAPPLSGEVRDGRVYGRGALDTKTLGILQLAAFVALHRSGVSLDRDVVYMATADEEAGGFFGAGWLVENRPELFEDVGFLLNEGGGGTMVEGQAAYGVEVTQKVPYWLRLTATGEPGHGSRPAVSSAATEMVAALERLRLHAFEPRIVPSVQAMFRGIAPRHPEPWRTRFQDLSAAVEEAGVLRELQEYDPGLHALTRNTCSITRFQGSGKINVVPTEVWAEIDCRLLPDQEPEAWLAELGGVLGPEVEVEVLMGFTPAVSSTDTELFRTLEEVTRDAFPDAAFVPQVQGGFTDSHFFRDLGIVSYGYSPMAPPQEDMSGVHGNNERVSEENVRRGTAMMLRILERFAATGPVTE